MRKLLLIAALSMCPAFAAPTRIVDTVKYANSTNASGMIRIEWPAFTVSGTAVAAGFVQVNIVNGVLDVSLQPTDLATPSGTVYTVRFYLQNSPVATEYWTVPTSASAVNLADVRTATLSALAGLHDVSTSNDWTQISTPGTNPASGYLRVYAKTGSGICWLSSAGTETCAGAGATWGAITGTLSSQSDLNTALADKASITGSYSNPSWITGLAWSKITSAPVASTTNGARVGSNDGVYLEPANPAIGFNAYYDSGWKFGNASPNNYAAIITRDASGNLVFSVSSATGATGASPSFNSMTFSQSTRKLSGVTPGTASGEVVALNGSSQVDLALIPTCSQAEAEAGTATTCLSTAERVAQAIAALETFQAAGAGVSCTSGTCGANYSEVMRWSVSAGTPSGTPTAGSIWNLDTDNGRPYYAIGGSWVRLPTYAEVALASHNHAASDIDSGTVATARLGSGTADSTTFLRGDNTWAVPPGTGGTATGEYSGTVNLGAIPDMGCIETTFSATGATTSMIVELGLPAAWETGLVASAWISAADTAKLRACNLSGASVDPASATFKVKSLGSLGLLTGSGTINFGSVPDMACLASTLSVSGAATGDHVTPGWPTALETGLTGSMFVSAADTVAVRLCNFSGAAVDPASATFKAAIVK